MTASTQMELDMRTYNYQVGTKRPWQSKTLWGGLIAAVIMAAGLFGYDLNVTDEAQVELVDQLVGAATAVGALVSTWLIVWGRLTANKKVKVKK